jgi:hypothetical protein
MLPGRAPAAAALSATRRNQTMIGGALSATITLSAKRRASA